jgi:DNA-binding Lrp family transcriptional regulator
MNHEAYLYAGVRGLKSNRIRNMARKPALDRIDVEIVRALARDAQQSNKEIAAAVGLAPSSCLERIRGLWQRGVLVGSHAEVDLAALGLALEAMLFVQLAKLRRKQVDRFVRSTAAVPEVRSVFLISGPYDLVVHLSIPSMDRLKEVISESFNRHACVVRVETSVVFDRRMHFGLPISIDAELGT